ncbi:MAG: hypothetical protein NTV34_18785, partial [Proteobacteria bacterium]|nr:hypothetical protein [Pseudomonadota bacterium]
GTFEGSSYKYKVSKSKEMTGAYELAPEKSPSGEIGSPLLVILKVKKDYKVTSLVEALIAKGITMPGGGGRIWIIGQPSPQATQGGSVIADDFHLDTSASNSSTPNSNPSAPHSNPASKPVSPPISTSKPGRFACGSIKGAGSGDFEFKSICLSETEATATTGTFEGSSYKYKVSKSKEMTGAYELAPEKSPSGEVGKPLLVILKIKKEYKVTSLVDALLAKDITVPGGGGRIWVVGHPHTNQNETFIADDFQLSQ